MTGCSSTTETSISNLLPWITLDTDDIPTKLIIQPSNSPVGTYPLSYVLDIEVKSIVDADTKIVID